MNSADITRLYEQIGNLIKEGRKKKKPPVSQEQLGKMVGMSRTSIVNIETGRHKIQIHTLYSIANELQIDILELLPNIHLETKRKEQYSSPVSDKSRKKLEKVISNLEGKER